MTAMTFDKLAYVDRLRAAGFNEPQARAMADGLDQALREEVATKSDVAALHNEIGLLRVEIKGEFGTLKSELGALKDELGEFGSDLRGFKDELGEFRSDLGGLGREVGDLRREQGALRGEVGGLKGELLAAMKADKVDLLKWLMMLIVGQTAVFTALKLLGH
jgi:hypothetical protein